MTDDHSEGASSAPRLRRRAVLAALATVPFGVGAIAVARSPERTLVVDDATTGERLLEHPVDDGETVVLAYTHSVEKTPVRDVYEVDDDALRMVRMEFYSFGAGLPTEGVERTDDGFVVYRDDRYERLSVAPREIPSHELVVGDSRYDLVELADDRVTISVGVDWFLNIGSFALNMNDFRTANGRTHGTNAMSRRP